MRTFPLPAILALSILLVQVAAAAPLHPRLGTTATGAALDRIPPEPLLRPSAEPGPREGRTWTGHPRLLVLLLDFTDRPADRETYDLAHFETLLFSRGEMEFGSARDWYREAGHDRLDLEGEVHGWLTMPRPYSVYAGNASGLCGSCSGGNARLLAQDALVAAINAGIHFGEFDNDGPDGIPGSGDDDGILDGLVLVVPGFGAERTGQLTDLRSHYWDLPYAPAPDGVNVPDYLLIPERENVGVAVHELGHLLGAEDLYDLSGRGAGLGNFSVMAGALWFNNARQPGGPDPLSRIQWGLLEPVNLRADEPHVEIPCILNEPFALRLWTRGEAGPEYFLVENRCPRGIDALLPGEGLLIYHVDETVRLQDNPGRYRISVLTADGLGSLQGEEPRNSGEPGDFFPGLLGVREINGQTTPSTRNHDGEITAVALHSIGDPGAVMTASAVVGRFIGTEPRPRLLLLPASGLFEGGVLPGAPVPVEIVLQNLGTRIPAGTLRLFSRDPHVRLAGDPLELPVGDVPPLDESAVGEVSVEILPGEGPFPVLPLEAELLAGGREFGVSTPLPLAANVIRRDGFEEERPDVTARALNGKHIAWHRSDREAAEGTWSWSTASYPGDSNSVLEVGPISTGGVTEIRFRHRMSTPLPNGSYIYDGGFLEVSRDGGTGWDPVFPEGGYPFRFGDSSGNPYVNLPAWGGDHDWEDVVVRVPPDPRGRRDLLLRFHFVSDFSGSNGLFGGWTVDALLVRTWRRGVVGVFDTPVVGESRIEIPWHVVPIVEDPVPGHVRLVRESGSEREVLETIDFDGALDRRTVLDVREPGRPDRFWLEWEDEFGGRTGPLVTVSPGDAPATLLTGTRRLIRRGDGEGIRFRVPGTSPLPVLLDLFDVRGARLAVLVDGERIPGMHEIPWPERLDTGGTPASGVYFLRLRGEGFSETRRVVVLP